MRGNRFAGSRWLAGVAAGMASSFLVAAGGAQAAGTSWYAYANGGVTGTVASCPQTATPASGCSLGAAAASASPGDTIYLATSGTYSGSWTLPSGVTIEPAPSVSGATLDGSGDGSPVLSVSGTAANTTTISGLTIQNGADGGVATATGATGTLAVQNTKFLDNTAASVGGAIDDRNGATGTLSVSGSTFTGNAVDTLLALGGAGTTDGGAIYVAAGAANVSQSTFTGNSVSTTIAAIAGQQVDGGAIYNAAGHLTVSGSTFGGTSAGAGNSVSNPVGVSIGATTDVDGGAIYSNAGSLTVRDSTFIGNSDGSAAEVGLGSIDVQDGGAIYAGGGTLTVAASTFNANTLPSIVSLPIGASADGLGTSIYSGGATAAVVGNLFGDATAANGCGHTGNWTDAGYNVGNSSCESSGSGDSTTAPTLAALAFNGGPTETEMLATGSAGVGRIPSGTSVTVNGVLTALCPATDSRGLTTVTGVACDAGATQSAPPALTITAPSAEITAGDSVPALTPTYSGFVLGQTASNLGTRATCTVTGNTSTPGTYPVTCSGAANSSADTALMPNTNYAISYSPGTLTVDAATVTNPGTSTTPGTGTTPGTSTNPGTSTTPGTSTNPGTSTTPGTSTNPGTSTTPGTGTSTNPGTGTTPGTGTDAGTDTTPGSTDTAAPNTDTGSTGSSGSSGTSGSNGSSAGTGSSGNNGTSGSSGNASTAAAEAPRSTSHPVVAGIARAGHVLNCQAGSWDGSPAPTYTYQWSLDGSPIAAATSSSYRVSTVDEGESLTCTITATNASGASSVTTAATKIPVTAVKGCPAATGTVSGATLGLARLGMTSAQMRHAYATSRVRTSADQQRFCLTPGSVRVAYVTSGLAQRLLPKARSRYTNRVGLILTASTHYQVKGIRNGESISLAEKKFKLAKFVVGKNNWYLATGKRATTVFRVQGGVVRELGLAIRALTRTQADRRIFLRSF